MAWAAFALAPHLLSCSFCAALRRCCVSACPPPPIILPPPASLLRCSPGSLPSYEAQVAALEALQMYAPMGHALGLSAVASQLEDRCFQVGWASCVCCTRCRAALRACVPAGHVHTCCTVCRSSCHASKPCLQT